MPSDPRSAYLAAGCASCHGNEGQGGVGPALAGHTAEQIETQVRQPTGNMPAYDEQELSDEQLALIVTYIEDLSPGGSSPGGTAADGHTHSHDDMPADDGMHADEDMPHSSTPTTASDGHAHSHD